MRKSTSLSITFSKLVRWASRSWTVPVLGGLLLLSVAGRGWAQTKPVSAPAASAAGVRNGSSETFTGTVWINPLVQAGDPTDGLVSEVSFEAGARTQGHTHAAGQLLVGMQGTGYYQEKGKPLRRIQMGEAVTVASNVAHWHGAAPNSLFTHPASLANASKTGRTWLQAVTEEEYNAIP